MGYYINHLSDGSYLGYEKLDALIKDGAKIVKAPTKESDWQPNLVCVMRGGRFDAAGYAYSPEEMMSFAEPDNRERVWLIYPNAARLSGYEAVNG